MWLPPGTSYSLAAAGPGPLRLDSVLLPAPAPGADPDGAEPASTGGPLLADLADQPAEITGDREFRVLFAPGQGCAAATQFVGEIPPGRAPFHSHTYDEVVLVLAGEGVLHIGNEDRPLSPGSCLHLAPGTPHCLENTGQAMLRVLGVSTPAAALPPRNRPAALLRAALRTADDRHAVTQRNEEKQSGWPEGQPGVVPIYRGGRYKI